MANQSTKLEDIIVPELFSQYVIDRTVEKAELIDSGVVQNNPRLDALVSGGGTVLTMPNWDDIGGNSQVFTMNREVETRKITSHKEFATMLLRNNAWSAHDLAGALAGDSPVNAIASLVGDFWKRDEQSIVGAVLNGVFASADMEPHILDATKGTNTDISGKAVLAAKQLLGDNAGTLTVMYMHSAVHTALQQQQLITVVPEAEGRIGFEKYLGYRIIVDDSAPVVLGSGSEKSKFTTYLLSVGCIQRGTGIPVDFRPTEVERKPSLATTILHNRQAKVLHPKGLSWAGAASITDETPSNTELETGTNWTLAVRPGATDAEKASALKKIGMVALVHTIDETL